MTVMDSTTGGGPPAWSDAELRDPHAAPDKAAKVRGMFGAIAQSYDLNNRLHSLGRDRAWRHFAVAWAGVKFGERVLDVACGTGELSTAFAHTDAENVVGLDFTPEMLDLARAKQAKLSPTIAAKLTYVEGDALALPFPDRSFDVVSIAFGIRNVTDPARALAEFHRVLRPKGRAIVLEFDRPSFAPLRWINGIYCARIMPWSATRISKDRSGAYKYLPRSVGTFMTRQEFLRQMGHTGFRDLCAKSLTLGVCVCYRGTKPH